LKVAFTPTAVRQIESRIAYLMSQGAGRAAVAARKRIMTFINDFLAGYPRTGRLIPEKGIYEIWIPRTRYIIFYRVEAEDTLRILALFHSAQDRSTFTTEDSES
jgi:plasmid stabilization system protein ParE